MSTRAATPRATRAPIVLLGMGCVLALLAQATQAAEPAARRLARGPAAQVPVAAQSATEPSKQALEDAVASVLVVALTQQFQGRQVSVEVETHDIAVSSARERLVSGQGRVRLGVERPEWITFGYRTLYDVVASNASYPVISLGSSDEAPERMAPNDATLLRQLDDQVVDALSRELGGARVWLQLDAIRSYEQGDRYVRINANGVADLGLDGATPVRVEALYDRAAAVWLRLTYDLGQQYAATIPGRM